MVTREGSRRLCLYFVFQAEDGIRDASVTGVQMCALPIYSHGQRIADQHNVEAGSDIVLVGDSLAMTMLGYENTLSVTVEEMRSEERRVGEECRSRGSPYH